MGNNQPFLKKKGCLFIVSLLTLLTYSVLFLARSLDDNRLTSWQWAFQKADEVDIFFILVSGIIIAFIISKFLLSRHFSSFFLFLISFVASFIFWKEPEVIVDASRYFTQAKHLEIYGIKYFIEEWGRGINAWTDMPVVPFLYGLIFKFFGETRVYIQIFSALIFSSTVVLTCMIGKTIWNEDTGLLGGLLLLGMPYLLTQVPLMLVDVATMFFVTLSIFIFIKAIERGGAKMIILSSVAIVFAIFSKYSTWLMLSVLIVIFLVYLGILPSYIPRHKGSGWKKVFYRVSIIALISGLLIGIVLYYRFDVFSEQIKLLMTYQRPGLQRWGESFISTFFFQIHPFLTIAALYSVYSAVKKKDFRYLIIIWMVLLVVFMDIRRIRYVIMVFPMFALMASYGLQEIKDKDLRKFVAMCTVTSSLIVAIFVYLPLLQSMGAVNLKDAGRYLNSVKAETIEVLTIPSEDDTINMAVSVPILDYFTDKNLYYHYDAGLPPPFEKISESSLRFTWEYKNPDYYKAHKTGLVDNSAIVVISDRPGRQMPDNIRQRIKGYQESKNFKTSAGLFRYRPVVMIYLLSPYNF